MLDADLGMLSALGMLNLGMLDAGFGMLSASCMQDFLLHFCECTPLNAEIFFFLRGQPSFVYIILFFANLSEPFFALFKEIF